MAVSFFGSNRRPIRGDGNLRSPRLRQYKLTELVGLALAASLGGTACTTSLHGSFSPHTYTPGESPQPAKPLGPVKGKSCQTRFLYVFPMGAPISTSAAIESAKKQREGTRFLADVAIDDRIHWHFGYMVDCIFVEATAY